ncbi:MAG: trimethylamine methyltransferase family protein [Ardenticatenaceae bacterium]|nr:trimethylamine methyltransferase family protein [Ardenticatenaceae bacterium]
MTRQRNAKRAERRAERLALPLLQMEFGTVRNGQRPYEILTPDQIQKIHDASLHILENVG